MNPLWLKQIMPKQISRMKIFTLEKKTLIAHFDGSVIDHTFIEMVQNMTQAHMAKYRVAYTFSRVYCPYTRFEL